MGTIAKQGSFTLSTTTGNQTITGLGFTPKLVILMASQQASVSGYQEHRRCYGAATGTGSTISQWVQMSTLNPGANRAGRIIKTNRCMLWHEAASSNSIIIEANFVSMNSDGFTINVVRGVSTPVYYLAIGGSSVNARCGYIDLPGSSGKSTVNVTGVGFSPTAAMFVSSVQTPPGSSHELWDSSTGFGLGFQVKDDNVRQLTAHFGQISDHNYGGWQTDEYSFGILGWDAVYPNLKGWVSAWNSNGMSLYIDDIWTGASVRLLYIALGGDAKYTAGSFLEPSSTGQQIVPISGVKPVASLFSSCGVTGSSSNVSEIRATFGMGVNVNQCAVSGAYGRKSVTNHGYASINSSNAVGRASSASAGFNSLATVSGGTFSPPGPTVPLTSTFTEAFSSPINSTVWGQYTDSGVTVNSSGGNLSISLVANQASERYGVIFTQGDYANYSLIGSYAYAKLEQAPSGSYMSEAYFIVEQDSNVGVGFWINGQGDIYCQVRNISPVESHTVPYNPSMPWLRIRESGGTVYWDRAPNTNNPPQNSDWVNIWSLPLSSIPFSIDFGMCFALGGGTWGSVSNPGTVVWDGVNIGTTGGSSPAPTPTPTTPSPTVPTPTVPTPTPTPSNLRYLRLNATSGSAQIWTRTTNTHNTSALDVTFSVRNNKQNAASPQHWQGPVFKWASSNIDLSDGYSVNMNTGSIALFKHGTELSYVTAGSLPVGVTKTIRVRQTSGTIRVYVDGTQVVSYNDTSPINSGYAGMVSTHCESIWDNMTGTFTENFESYSTGNRTFGQTFGIWTCGWINSGAGTVSIDTNSGMMSMSGLWGMSAPNNIDNNDSAPPAVLTGGSSMPMSMPLTMSQSGLELNWSSVSGSQTKYSFFVIGEPSATAARMMIGIFN